MSNAIQRAEPTTNGTGINLTPTLQDTLKLGEVFAKSGYFTDARDASQAVVKILAGAELGLPAMSAMSGIYIVQGRPTLSANLMAALVKRSGRYNYRVTEHSDKACTILYFECLGGNWEQIGESRFTIEDARRAKTKNIEMFPRNMLFARAMSNGVRWYCPDVTSGPTYTPDELNEGMETEALPGSYTEAPVAAVAPPASLPEPILSSERAELQQTAKERFNAREFSHFLWEHFQAKQIKELSEEQCVRALSLIEERSTAKAQVAAVDTETGEIFEEDAFASDGEQQRQDREELLSAIADLEAVAEQQGEYNGPAYRITIGVPPTLSLCSLDHLKTYRSQLSAYVSQDEGIFGDEAPPMAQGTDLRAVRG